MKKQTALTLIQLTERFPDAASARRYLESMRWPEGPACPHCGGAEVYRLTPKPESKRPGRSGLLKCKYCRKQFTVTVGTIFEDSHIPLNKWLIAIYLMCASKKGMSAHQLHRMLSISYKAAWFMCHRIRYAMHQPEMLEKMSGVVELDETYIGGKVRPGAHIKAERETGHRPAPFADKAPVVTLVQRNGKVRSMHVSRVTTENLRAALLENVETTSTIMTDTSPTNMHAAVEYAAHERVNHKAREYSRPGGIHTNTVEGYFANLKRGINGVYHHVGRKHLHRYLAEFDFRYNAREINDGERTELAIAGFEGKRLKYKD